jgi:very-short-patch-repair endonuclease
VADELFLRLLKAKGLPVPIPEYRFHPTRKYRADYCWPLHRLILEVDGGIWVQGRHTRGAGWLKDTEKMALAAILGYRWMRATPQMLRGPQLLGWLAEALK